MERPLIMGSMSLLYTELAIYPDHLSSSGLVGPSFGCRPNGHFRDWLESRKLTVTVDHIAAGVDAKTDFDENEMVNSYSCAIIMQGCSKRACYWRKLPLGCVGKYLAHLWLK